MKEGRKKSAAGVSRSRDSPPQKSLANGDSTESLSRDKAIRMHQKLRPRRLEKGKQLMKEISEEDEYTSIENREVNLNEDDQDDEEAEEEEEADEQQPKLAKGFYVIEAIRKKRRHKGVKQYFIKWRDWPESANTWEPIENLQTCTDLIEAFEERSQSKSGRKRKRRHRVTPQPNSLPSGAVMDSLNAVETEVAAIVDSSNAVDENMNKLDEVSVHVQVFSGDKVEKDMCSSSVKINEHNGLRSENLQRLDEVSVNVQEPAAPESVALVNEVASADGQDVSQSGRQVGAKRRKSGAVKRFKPESTSREVDNAQDETIRTSSTNGIQINGVDSNKSENPEVTKIIKVIEYTASASANTLGVAVNFLALRADGKEVVVNNKYLKAHHPLLLIDFYERNLRYNAPQ